MAHGAFHTVGGMRAGFPLVIDRLMAGGTGVPGWNQPVVYMRSLILLSHGRLEGSSRKENKEQGGAKHTRAKTIHGKILLSTTSQYDEGDACQSVIPITYQQDAIVALDTRSAKRCETLSAVTVVHISRYDAAFRFRCGFWGVTHRPEPIRPSDDYQQTPYGPVATGVSRPESGLGIPVAMPTFRSFPVDE